MIIAGLSLMGCAEAEAQGTPPPAVTVVLVESREVTDTGEFVGRVVAIDKVDVVARVPGFIEERYFTEGQEVLQGAGRAAGGRPRQGQGHRGQCRAATRSRTSSVCLMVGLSLRKQE